uniref:SCP domain-containing protein n=1 Tax=Panagrellus redivivus TaxID=6233 RepID=A0A7E4V3J0_PANRE
MRGILTSLALVFALSVRRAECSPWIECDANIICQDSDRKEFAEKQALYKLLLEANRDSPLIQAIANRSSLCTDMNMIGFLADGKSADSYPIACLWSGGDSSGVCAPAPPNSGDLGYEYMPAAEWAKKVKAVRKSIGCSNQQVADSDRAGELYICRERCIQLGLGEYNSAVASFAVICSIIVVFMLT